MIDWPLRDVFHENVTPERIVMEAKKAAQALLKKLINSLVVRRRDVDDTNVDNDDPFSVADFQPVRSNNVFSAMHYGIKDKNPLDPVEFYSKRHYVVH